RDLGGDAVRGDFFVFDVETIAEGRGLTARCSIFFCGGPQDRVVIRGENSALRAAAKSKSVHHDGTRRGADPIVTRASGPSVVGSRLTSEGGKSSGFTVPDWLTWSFTGLPYFSEISVVYQAFS